MTFDNDYAVPPDGEPPARTVARWFHDEYERLAPDFGYRTREESAVPWVDVPDANRDLMIATAECVLRRLAAGRAAASPDPPAAADLVAAHLRERWPCTCRPGMDGGGVYHAADCNSRREGSQAVLAVIRLLRAATPPASPDERLREEPVA